MQRTFQKGATSVLEYPLMELPQTSNGLSDPHVGQPNDVPPPVTPGDVGWDEQVELFTDCRADVETGRWPNRFFQSVMDVGFNYLPLPFVETGTTSIEDPAGAATLVHMDDPWDLGLLLFDWLWSKGVRVKASPFMHKYGRHNYYLRAKIEFARLLTANLLDIYHGFMQVKYYYGLVRPEEYFNLPGCVVTRYEEGCPTHCSYVAGHGSSAGRVYRVLTEFFDLSASLYASIVRELLNSALYFAHFRTLAGVHWAQDNSAGVDYGRRGFLEA